MRIEGIIIHKTPYKERDVICNLLLRSGKLTSVYFYGGRGGGKNQKGSVLEVGFMLGVELSPRRKKIESDIKIAKEYNLLWSATHTRTSYAAFCLASFYMEYLSKISVAENHLGFEDHEHEGVFNVLSNALFYLDEAVKNNNLKLKAHLFLFLSKLSVHLGIAKNVDDCLYCDKRFLDSELCFFDIQNGGFSCLECNSQKGEYLSDNKGMITEYQSSLSLRLNLRRSYSLAFKLVDTLDEVSFGVVNAEFNYINYQFGLKRELVRTWGVLFAK
ncbi:MAG: hypothetical protein HON90_02830 [Halobacteriovoraceae bacterium]|jgi:DNA repair protein RecO|nr:hypothetical protein [Halobacteriovoraceae bacterium]